MDIMDLETSTTTVTLIDRLTTFAHENSTVLLGATFALTAVLATHYYLSKSTIASQSGSRVLAKGEYRKFPLVDKQVVSHNTRLFRFALPHPKDKLGLPLGWHLSLRAMVDGKEIRRPYTPTSTQDDKGGFDLVIKVYPEPYGKMSRYLDSLDIGDDIEVKGPIGRFKYARNQYRRICMIAGGTGITPMWQVFQYILNDPTDRTQIHLIFANVNEDDILLKDELDEMERSHDNFTVYYVLNNPPEAWDGGKGFVSEEHIRQQFGSVDPSYLYCLCGPPPMTKAMKTHLSAIGYQESQVHKF